MDDEWSSSTLLHIYTDASDLGLGCVFNSHWFAVEFDDAERNMIIAWRELYAIILACFTWGENFTGKKILMHCDNQTIVDIVQSGTTRNRDIMCLVRVLFHICVRYNFDMRIVYIPGLVNLAADRLSRLNYEAFFTDKSTYFDDLPTPCRRSFD